MTSVPFGRHTGGTPTAIAVGGAVRLWLAMVVAMVGLMILVGGATRLTDSGLSITEWKPVTGVLLPLGDAAWLAEFDKYRQIPQYSIVNKGMSLPEFKSIYLWEWGHRLLGRFIGFAYLLPLLIFIARGQVRGRLLAWLLALGVLGGLQGAIGWLMVASGLKPGMVAVAPVKLMLHMTVACLLLAALAATWVRLRPGGGVDAPRVVRFGAFTVIGLLFVQIALGALVAGLDAGLIYNTWPTMDGALVPPASVLFPRTPWWRNVFETVATVQFNHRVGAYFLLAAAFWHAWTTRRAMPGSPTARSATVLAVFIGFQALLGIVTLVLQVPIWAGLAHQGWSVLVLVAAVRHAGAFSHRPVAVTQQGAAHA